MLANPECDSGVRPSTALSSRGTISAIAAFHQIISGVRPAAEQRLSRNARRGRAEGRGCRYLTPCRPLEQAVTLALQPGSSGNFTVLEQRSAASSARAASRMDPAALTAAGSDVRRGGCRRDRQGAQRATAAGRPATRQPGMAATSRRAEGDQRFSQSGGFMHAIPQLVLFPAGPGFLRRSSWVGSSSTPSRWAAAASAPRPVRARRAARRRKISIQFRRSAARLRGLAVRRQERSAS